MIIQTEKVPAILARNLVCLSSFSLLGEHNKKNCGLWFNRMHQNIFSARRLSNIFMKGQPSRRRLRLAVGDSPRVYVKGRRDLAIALVDLATLVSTGIRDLNIHPTA